MASHLLAGNDVVGFLNSATSSGIFLQDTTHSVGLEPET